MNRKGFTLIEILVVIGIFAIIVVVGSMSFFNLFKGSARTKAANLVKQDGEYTMGIMTKMIRNARNISDCRLGMNEIEITSPDGRTTTFSCFNNPISSNSAKLINDQLAVSDCNFDCHEGTHGEPEAVVINFTLGTGTSIPLVEQVVVDFETTVVLRNIPAD